VSGKFRLERLPKTAMNALSAILSRESQHRMCIHAPREEKQNKTAVGNDEKESNRCTKKEV
jgi:hypothetical protein